MSDEAIVAQAVLVKDDPSVPVPVEHAPVPFFVRGPLVPHVGAEFIADLEAIDPVFQCHRPTEDQQRWAAAHPGAELVVHLATFGVFLGVPEADDLVVIGSLLRYGCPVLVFADRADLVEAFPNARFLQHPKVFGFNEDQGEDLVAFVRRRIVRKISSYNNDFWLSPDDLEHAVVAADLQPGDPVWFPCDQLWEAGVASAIDDPGPYPTEVSASLRDAYRDVRKEGPEKGVYVTLEDADILASSRRAWAEPFVVVDALGGDPARNGALSRRLRKRLG